MCEDVGVRWGVDWCSFQASAVYRKYVDLSWKRL